MKPTKPAADADAKHQAKSLDGTAGLCPLNAFNRAAMGKYKMRIIWELSRGARRYGELRRSAIVTAMGKAVTPRVLSRELKELQQRGMIHRKQYPVVPPKVEYTLTDMGKTLVPVIKEIVDWGMTARHAVVLYK